MKALDGLVVLAAEPPDPGSFATMLALTALVLGWSPVLYYVVTGLCIGGVFSMRWMR